MRSAVAVVLLAGACVRQAPLQPAGGDKDDGHGGLAKASARFLRAETDDDELFDSTGSSHRRDGFGGHAYGGDAYGGATYATFVVPQWQYQGANRTPKYSQMPGLTGAIEGTVSWKGAAPAKRTTACGPIERARVGPDRGVGDVLVYIERVQVGRALPADGKPTSVGGLVVKRNCALVPSVQIVTPLPAAMAIHADDKPANLRVTTAPAAPRLVGLQEGGRALMQVQPGITRVDAADGSLAAAWVHALDTPYYALTDDHGRFRLDELSPGTYDVTIWQAPITDDGAPIVVHRSVRVDATKPTRLDVAIGR